MFQDSIHLRSGDARRARRYALPSRMHLTLSIAAAEGVFAAGIFWAVQRTLSIEVAHAPTPLIAAQAIVTGMLYCVLGIRAARQLASASSAPRYDLPGAALSLLLAVAGGAFLASSLGGMQSPSPELAWVGYALSAAMLIPFRIVLYRAVAAMMDTGRFQIERVALLGRANMVNSLEQDYPLWRRGGQVVATLAITEAEVLPQSKIESFVASCTQQRCDSLLLVGDLRDFPHVEQVITACEAYAIDVLFAPASLTGPLAPRMLDTRSFGPARSVRVRGKPLGELELLTKRLFDVTVAATGLLLLSPLLLILAALVRVTSPGPALYVQQRRGFNGQSFPILKFRTMSVTEAADNVTPACPGDARITPLGHWLRRASLDELPQLINVLLGHMSLVGPRPHAISHDRELSRRFALYAQRQRIKPGITGWAQVNGHRGDVSTPQSLEARTVHDLHYVENWSIAFDIKILMLTFLSSKTHQNAR